MKNTYIKGLRQEKESAAPATEQPKQTLEQFNKERGIATITSFEVVGNTPKHTQGQWKNSLTGIRSEKGLLIAQLWCGEDNDSFGRHPAVTYPEMKANAERIVKAVNMHDELINALKELNGYSSQLQHTFYEKNMKTHRDSHFELTKKVEQLLKQAEGK